MLDGRAGGGEGGGYRRRGRRGAPAVAVHAAGTRAGSRSGPAGRVARGGAGGPSWDAPKGGDLDDEIPF